MEKRILLDHGGRKTPCIVSEPEYGVARRLVLGVHGLGGCMTDDIQCNLAEEMSLFGSVALRFDFPAHGENPDRSLTLQGCVDALLDTAEYAREQYPHLDDMCIFATGFGAFVTLNAMQDLMDMGRVKLVIQTPSFRMDETLLRMKGMSKVTLEALGKTSLGSKRPLEITYEFYRELWANQMIRIFPLPILILQGEADAYIPMEDIQLFQTINEHSRLVIIPGASHRFLEPGAWDMVLDLTRDWFEFEQVLLAEVQ